MTKELENEQNKKWTSYEPPVMSNNIYLLASAENLAKKTNQKDKKFFFFKF